MYRTRPPLGIVTLLGLAPAAVMVTVAEGSVPPGVGEGLVGDDPPPPQATIRTARNNSDWIARGRRMVGCAEYTILRRVSGRLDRNRPASDKSDQFRPLMGRHPNGYKTPADGMAFHIMEWK
jgi:hypothetical protein